MSVRQFVTAARKTVTWSADEYGYGTYSCGGCKKTKYDVSAEQASAHAKACNEIPGMWS